MTYSSSKVESLEFEGAKVAMARPLTSSHLFLGRKHNALDGILGFGLRIERPGLGTQGCQRLRILWFACRFWVASLCFGLFRGICL